MADLHLQLKPGTDGALALGIAKVILDNGWADMDYVEKHTAGFEEYRAEVQKFDLKTVEEITGVAPSWWQPPRELIATGGPACMHQSASPITQHRNGFRTTAPFSPSWP